MFKSGSLDNNIYLITHDSKNGRNYFHLRIALSPCNCELFYLKKLKGNGKRRNTENLGPESWKKNLI